MELLKRGHKSTEFIIHCIVQVTGVLVASGIVTNDHWVVRVSGLVVMMLSAIFYGNNRTALKKADLDNKYNFLGPFAEEPEEEVDEDDEDDDDDDDDGDEQPDEDPDDDGGLAKTNAFESDRKHLMGL